LKEAVHRRGLGHVREDVVHGLLLVVGHLEAECFAEGGQIGAAGSAGERGMVLMARSTDLGHGHLQKEELLEREPPPRLVPLGEGVRKMDLSDGLGEVLEPVFLQERFRQVFADVLRIGLEGLPDQFPESLGVHPFRQRVEGHEAVHVDGDGRFFRREFELVHTDVRFVMVTFHGAVDPEGRPLREFLVPVGEDVVTRRGAPVPDRPDEPRLVLQQHFPDGQVPSHGDDLEPFGETFQRHGGPGVGLDHGSDFRPVFVFAGIVAEDVPESADLQFMQQRRAFGADAFEILHGLLEGQGDDHGLQFTNENDRNLQFGKEESCHTVVLCAAKDPSPGRPSAIRTERRTVVFRRICSV